MRRSTLAVLLLVSAAGSSQCSDSPAPVGVLPSPNPSGAAFSNGGSVQSDDAQTPSGGPVSSISRLAVTVVTDNNADGRPSRGDSVTFVISTTQKWSQVAVVCSQDGAVVLRASRTPAAWSPIALSSEAWKAGGADCMATLDQINDTRVLTLATAAFSAGA